MSEKKELRWENPAEIYVPGFLNNRELNPAYVESLEDSMRKEGFLPTFPIVCFRRLDIPYFDDFTSVHFMFARVGCIGQPPLRISDLIRSI